MPITERIGTVYGPVASRRLGRSLGIDLIALEHKVCSLDCLYCQLGRTSRRNKTVERREFVPKEKILNDLRAVIGSVEADRITFAGTGEPTLASNLGKVAEGIRDISDLQLAILTNASLMWREDVRNDLKNIDLVCAKLDAPNEEIFEQINKPLPEITLNRVIEGITEFRKEYKGKLALQIMFVEQNKNYAAELASIARSIGPDEVQLNTPLRKPSKAKPLSEREMKQIASEFSGLNATNIYDLKTPVVRDLNPLRTRMTRPSG